MRPLHDTSPPTPGSLVVFNANVGNGFAPDAALIGAIGAANADLVALEELNAVQAEVIGAALRDRYPHQATFGDSYEGKGLFSRWPLADAHQLHLIEGRPDIRATFTFAMREVTVILAHPRPPKVRREGIVFDRRSVRQVLGLGALALESAPAIMVGDFNMSPRHPIYRRFVRAGLVDTAAAQGDDAGMATFPIRFGDAWQRGMPVRRLRVPPMMRFDYIWHTPEFVTEAAWIGPDTGSDHLPVMARLRLLPDGREG
ncbi:MAG: endonuclease/exonuclease/phosphatase family protein [Thermomicrobiales bacterium]